MKHRLLPTVAALLLTTALFTPTAQAAITRAPQQTKGATQLMSRGHSSTARSRLNTRRTKQSTKARNAKLSKKAVKRK